MADNRCQIVSPAWRDGAGHPALPVREAGRDEERAHLAAAHPGHAALVAADHAARAQLEPAATSGDVVLSCARPHLYGGQPGLRLVSKTSPVLPPSLPV